jgi:hypothetical protein
MASVTRGKLIRNPNYQRHGLKSYVHALHKCKCHSTTYLPVENMHSSDHVQPTSLEIDPDTWNSSGSWGLRASYQPLTLHS